MEKLYSSKTCLKTAGGEDASPTFLLDPPLPTWTTMSLTTTPTSRFGFSMMCGQFCHSCFEITARTALAQSEHLTLKTKVRFEKGRSTPQTPLGASLVNLLFYFGYLIKCHDKSFILYHVVQLSPTKKQIRLILFVYAK